MKRRHFLTRAATSTAAIALGSLAIPRAAAAAAAATPTQPDPATLQRGEDWGDLGDAVRNGTAAANEHLTVYRMLEPSQERSREIYLELAGASPVTDEVVGAVACLLELRIARLVSALDDLHATAAAAGRPIGRV